MGFLDDLFGNLFDLDGDGKTTPDEEFLAYMMWNEANKEDGADDMDALDDDLFSDDEE